MNSETGKSHDMMNIARELGLKKLSVIWSGYQQQDEGDVHIILLGEFNHGKSSLVNALVGENILPYGVTPTTRIDTYIRFGQARRQVTASCCSETVRTWNWDEWKKYCKVIHQQDDIHYDRLDIEIDSDVFDDKCVFIDTPGLNEASLSRENYIERYTSRAEILLFVIDASQPLTRSEQAVLKKLTDPGMKPAHLMLVANKCDRLDDEEMLDVCAFIEQTIYPFLGDDVFYMVSSRKPDNSELPLLREDILRQYHQIVQNADYRSKDRQNREMIWMLKTFFIISRLMSLLTDEQKSSVIRVVHSIPEHRYHILTDEMLEIVSERLSQCIHLSESELSLFCTEFLSAMPREIDKSSISDTESYFEDYIDSQYNECAETLKNRLNHQCEQIISELYNCIYHHAMNKTGNFVCPSMDSVCEFAEVNHKIHHTVRTGAFDDSRSLFLLDLGLAGTIIGRPSHQRKQSLKQMAKTAIERRCEEFSQAFSRDLDNFRSMISHTLRETSSQFFAHLEDLMMLDNKLTSSRLDEIEAELCSLQDSN